MYKEGKAVIKHYDKAFLNPNAALSRDISVAFVDSVADKKSTLLDATAVTGIRGIRYALETPITAKNMTLIDMNKSAHAAMKKNLAFNKVKAKNLNTSIQEFANNTRERFDVIDFDPFGGVSTNLQDLLKVSKTGTYLMVTVTDTAVLCGAHAKACIRLYDARPLHNELCHETGVRILIAHIAKNAALFNFGIQVMLSLSYMHYMRVFIRLQHGAANALASLDELGYVNCCRRCHRWSYEKAFFPSRMTCPTCKDQMEIAGRMWMGNLYDKQTLSKMESRLSENLDSYVKKLSVKENPDVARIAASTRKTLAFVEELKSEEDIPLYYNIPKLTAKLGISSVSPPKVIDALKKKGFRASGTHMHGSSIKTDATLEQVESAIKSSKAIYSQG